MKKYLMTGIAALAMCAGFTSCSHDVDPISQEQLDQLETEKVFQNYQKAFIATFGQPAANQTWGFGGTVYTRTADTHHNQWGDPNYFGYNIPPALTEGQKLRVKAYFQANPYLTYVDPEMKDFFVQQVYKGNPATAGNISSEQYTQTNGTKVTGSENMDWLYAGNNNDHINDFNKGDYNNGETVQVLNTGANTNNYATDSHPDQITLMLNSSTEYIAFGSSTGNQYHTNCCALASAAVIDAWAAQNGNIGQPVVDGWNRSFVGLDYEDRTIDGLTTGSVAKALDFCQSDYILYQNQIVQKSSFTDFVLTDPNGKQVPYVSDNISNQAIADYIKVNGNNVTKDTYNYNMSKEQFAEKGVTIQNQEARIYNLDMVISYVNQSAVPTQNNGNWVKNIGGRDYVFSDWIVTLTPALKENKPKRTTLRVMAEDLSANEASDFDFNDVVLDFVANEAGTEATIILQAAGGTLPLRINQNDDWEVHKKFGVATNVMVNTNAQAKRLNGDSKAPVTLGTVSGDFSTENFCKTVNGIKIEVQKNGVWMELTANEGQACCKFGCDPKFPWVNERQPIEEVYQFSAWVQGFTTTLLPANNN